MRYNLILFLLAVSVILCQSVSAEDSIRILMHEDPASPLPSDNSEDIGRINGKVFYKGSVYEGDLQLRRDEKGLYIINDLPFRQYIEGVVSSETGKDWELEALKAQAVISRTYAVFHKEKNLRKDYHLTSGTLHQVYNGKIVNPLVKQAVGETTDEILTFNNLPIVAFYHSTCEGKTELPEEVWGLQYPYFQSVDCMTRNAPYESWRKVFTTGQFEAATGISGVVDVMVSEHTATGRVKTLRIMTRDGETGSSGIEISATRLRQFLGYKELPSTAFTLKTEDGALVFEGKGWGHGVGLSQWGALEMARQGKNYREILSHFYPGTVIRNYALQALNSFPHEEFVRPGTPEAAGTEN